MFLKETKTVDMLPEGTYNKFIKLLKGTFKGGAYALRTWLRNARKVKGFTHEKAAEESEISRSYYTLIESGKKTPTVPVAKNIGKALGLDWKKFFEQECSLKEQNAQPA